MGWKAIGRSFAVAVSVGAAVVGLGLAAAALCSLVPLRYTPLGIYLVYCAVVIARKAFAWEMVTGWRQIDAIRTFLLDDLALIMTGCVSAALLVKTYQLGASLWLYGLAAPCLVALAYAFSGDRTAAAPEPADEAINAEAGKLETRLTLVTSLVKALRTGLIYFAMIAVGAVGVAIWLLLDECLFGSGAMGPFAAAAWAMARRVAPYAVLMAAFMVGLTFTIGVVAVFFHWLSLAGHSNANRDLSRREVAFIETSAEAVRTYGNAQGYHRCDWSAVVALTLIYVAMGAAAVFAVYKGFFPGGAPPDIAAGAMLYLPPQAGPSCVLLVFAAIAAIPLPSYLISTVWRRYSVYSTWRGLVNKKTEYVSLKGRLTNFVRIGRLDPHRAFDPGWFLHHAGQSLGRLTLAPLIPLMAIAGWFYWLDSHNFDAVFSDKLVVVRYWTGKPVEYPWKAVQGVELECVYDSKHNLDFAYRIRLPEGFAINAAAPLRAMGDIAPLIAIDDKVRAMKLPRSYATRTPLWQDPFVAFDPGCVRDLASEFPARDAASVRRIFHLGDKG